LPQLGQVRWESVLMFSTANHPQSQQTATPRSQRLAPNRPARLLATVVSLHERSGVALH